ncbi:MAG: lipocalin family protein [Bacteroides sp.]|nr:lipocalin family protein [Bacteroides sp.]
MKFLKYLLFLVSISVLMSLTGCRKVSHNGKIDGFWQITTIEDTSTGSVSEPSTREYISINLHIMQLTGASRLTANMTYDKSGAKITCDFPYVKQEDVDRVMGVYGFFSNPVSMDVVKVDGKQLILRTDRTLITCRRF